MIIQTLNMLPLHFLNLEYHRLDQMIKQNGKVIKFPHNAQISCFIKGDHLVNEFNSGCKEVYSIGYTIHHHTITNHIAFH